MDFKREKKNNTNQDEKDAQQDEATPPGTDPLGVTGVDVGRDDSGAERVFVPRDEKSTQQESDDQSKGDHGVHAA